MTKKDQKDRGRAANIDYSLRRYNRNLTHNKSRYHLAIQRLLGPQFAARFRLRPNQLCWFLGSGASAAANVPTGYAMIAEFKKILFCQLTGTPLRQVDTNDTVWIERIDQLFRARAMLPTPGDPSEYARAFEAVHPRPEDRRTYIETAIRRGTPSFAHRVLASLISTKCMPCAFTTNFDPLVEQAATITDQMLAAAERAHLTVAGIDNPARAALALREARPFLAKLHGDYQSVELMNTTDELKVQDVQMRAVLIGACARFGLIIVGYSGRDASVMQALTDAIAQPNAFPAGIHWVTSNPGAVMPAVSAFLAAADAAGISTTFVESQNFDELAGDLIDGMSLPESLQKHIHQARPDSILVDVPLPTKAVRRFPVLQCSAVPVLKMPAVARRITVKDPTTSREVRRLLREANVRAIVAANGQTIAAFGADDEIIRALISLSPVIDGEIDLRPDQDSWAVGLLYEALVKALCRDRFVYFRRRFGRYLILAAKGADDQPKRVADLRASQHSGLRNAYGGALYGAVPVMGFPFSEGVLVRLEHISGKWWCALEPTTHVELPRAETDARPPESEDADKPYDPRAGDPVIDWRRERWATRYNRAWAQIISAWASLLVRDGQLRSQDLDDAKGVNGVFELSSVTAWSRPANEHPYFNR